MFLEQQDKNNEALQSQGLIQTEELAARYHPNDPLVRKAAQELTTENFLRYFITSHGMKPTGIWRTHTYAKYLDSHTGRNHFFLIPMAKQEEGIQPAITVDNGSVLIDTHQTGITLQDIPHTTPFWYFHYNPNRKEKPYHSLTLNLSPSCLEKCVLCAGAKTGRVNNGMDDTLSVEMIAERIFTQHPEAREQLDSVAVVTGCFKDFNEMKSHLTNVRKTFDEYSNPSTYQVLEHNVTNHNEFNQIVNELGYDIFVTLECFDQKIRNIALNGKVGRKGRNSKEFISILENYAEFLDANPQLNKSLIRVTYLVGLDDLKTMEYFLNELNRINNNSTVGKIIPWLSIFTAYNAAMRRIQTPEFNFNLLLRARELCLKYFDADLLNNQSGGTSDGYARGFF